MKIPDTKAAVDKEWKKLETIPARDVKKAKSKKEVIKEGQKNNKVHCVTLMDICHLKNLELEPQFQMYKGRVVFRGDIVKDDSGAYAVCTEQDSSASQMTAAKVMDVLARLPDCDGQAADAISAYTQKKMEDALKLLKIPKSECPDVRIRLPKHKWPKSWTCKENPVIPHERNLYGHPLAGLVWKDSSKKALVELDWEKVPNWEYFFVHWRQKLFLSVYVDDIKMARKKQNLAPMWKKLMKNVDNQNPIALDHVHFGCTQRECKPNEKIIGTIQQDVWIPYFCWSNWKITRMGQTTRKNFSVVPRHGRTCPKMRGTVERYYEWATRRRSNCTKFLILVWTITKSKRKNWKIKVNCQKCVPISNKNACTWHELVDLTFCGQSINWHDLSQNGLEHVPVDWHD